MATFKLEGIDHIAINVSDMEESVAWYRDVLGLERRHRNWEMPVMLCAGSTCVALFRAPQAPKWKHPDAGEAGIRHLAFRAAREDFQQAQAALSSRGIPFQFEDHDMAHSIYFQDPDGIQIEITTYEV
ncbi:MAG TPA: VOC family protein [Acidobacteriota bacterium]|jgi:catechol 2,3-dioxygenase-like lactoylglutathione lyase family enzyme